MDKIETIILAGGLIFTFLSSFATVIYWSATIGRDVKSILEVLKEIKGNQKIHDEQLKDHEHRITVLEGK